MARCLLRAEGVNFDATLLDTDDLSTVRGASIALLRVGVLLERVVARLDIPGDIVFSGASVAAISLERAPTEPGRLEEIVAAEAARPGPDGEPFDHLMFVVEAAPIEPGHDENQAQERALIVAEARGRARQFRTFTTPAIALDREARRPDALDGVRPAAASTGRSQPGDDGRAGIAQAVSASVKARKEYGRKARQGFYAMDVALGKKQCAEVLGDLTFVDDLQAMVEMSERERRDLAIPVGVRSKIAVVYADGNGFGAARTNAGSTREFSRELRALQSGLLAQLLTRFSAGARATGSAAFTLAEGGRLRLRFETLLWGGDEMCFVLPAWLAPGFVAAFLQATAGWKVAGQALTHAVGVAIADRKTPIRQLRAIAKHAADGAKEAGLHQADSVTFDIFESLAPPDVDLAAGRAGLFGASALERDFAARLAMEGGVYDALLRDFAALVDDFPRSQVWGALMSARKASPADLLSERAGAAARASIDAWGRRGGSRELCDRLLGEADNPMMRLIQIARLWDYVAAAPDARKCLAGEAR